MPADPTPEERAREALTEHRTPYVNANTGASITLGEPYRSQVVSAIREAEAAARRTCAERNGDLVVKVIELKKELAAARSKAFEEAAEIAETEVEPTGPMPPALYMAATMHPEQSSIAAMRATKASIAKRIRARAKEAPRGS